MTCEHDYRVLGLQDPAKPETRTVTQCKRCHDFQLTEEYVPKPGERFMLEDRAFPGVVRGPYLCTEPQPDEGHALSAKVSIDALDLVLPDTTHRFSRWCFKAIPEGENAL